MLGHIRSPVLVVMKAGEELRGRNPLGREACMIRASLTDTAVFDDEAGRLGAPRYERARRRSGAWRLYDQAVATKSADHVEIQHEDNRLQRHGRVRDEG